MKSLMEESSTFNAQPPRTSNTSAGIKQTPSEIGAAPRDSRLQKLDALLKEDEKVMTMEEAALLARMTPADALAELMYRVFGDRGYEFVARLGDLEAKDAKALSTGFMTLASPVDRAVPMKMSSDVRTGEFANVSASILRKGLVAQNTSTTQYVLPSDLCTKVIKECPTTARVKEVGRRGLILLIPNVGDLFLPIKELMTDEISKKLIDALFVLTGKVYYTLPVQVERMFRFLFAVQPVTIGGIPSSFQVIPQSADQKAVVWKFGSFALCPRETPFVFHPKFERAYTLVLNHLNGRDKDGKPIPGHKGIIPGADKDPFIAAMSVIERNHYEQDFIDDASGIFTMFDPDSVMVKQMEHVEGMNIPPQSFDIPALLKKGYTREYIDSTFNPTNALQYLFHARRFRQGLRDSIADIVTSSSNVYDKGVAMCAKVKGVQMAHKMPSHKSNMCVIGVNTGNDRFLWRHWNTKFYDVNPKNRPGLQVDFCDVRREDLLTATLAGNRGAFFDVCNNKAGKWSFKEVDLVSKCSYSVNEDLFARIGAAVGKSDLEWFGMKCFLPPYEQAPAWLLALAPKFNLKFVKSGKYHNDEFYVVGVRGKTEDFPKVWARAVLRLSALTFTGNLLATRGMCCGSLQGYCTPENVIAQANLVGEDIPLGSLQPSGFVIKKVNPLSGRTVGEVANVESEYHKARAELMEIEREMKEKPTFRNVIISYIEPKLLSPDDLKACDMFVRTNPGVAERAKRAPRLIVSQAMFAPVLYALRDPDSEESKRVLNVWGASDVFDQACVIYMRRNLSTLE